MPEVHIPTRSTVTKQSVPISLSAIRPTERVFVDEIMSYNDPSGLTYPICLIADQNEKNLFYILDGNRRYYGHIMHSKNYVFSWIIQEDDKPLISVKPPFKLSKCLTLWTQGTWTYDDLLEQAKKHSIYWMFSDLIP